LVLVAAASLLIPAPAWGVSSAEIVQVINAERHANGLPPVREDSALSAGCAAEDNYRRMNGSIDDAFTPRGEDPSKPGYSTAGSRAARNSLFNAGDRPGDSFAGGDVFDDAPNHLVALMDPAVKVIGADQLNFNAGPLFGTASLSCIDVRSAPPRSKPRRLHVYSYVGPDGKAPRDPSYREGPSGSGPFLFLYFDAPKGARVTLRALTIRRPNGSISKPSLVAVSGGLIDGRARARAANTTKPSGTPTAETRDPFVGDPADDLDWLAGIKLKGRPHEVGITGRLPVSLR
jgi:hypothetical protein